MERSTNDYPGDWPEIAYRVKEKAGWGCERCGHPHDPKNGYMLGVHHLDHDKSNCVDWNLAALCQRCHCHVEQVPWEVLVGCRDLFTGERPEWLRPHVEGYLLELHISERI